MGSNLARHWAFYFFSNFPLLVECPLSGPSKRFVVKEKNGSLAVLLGANRLSKVRLRKKKPLVFTTKVEKQLFAAP